MSFLKVLKWTILTLAALMALGILLFLVWISPALYLGLMMGHSEELQRVQSPDGKYSAILMFSDAGATSATYYAVYLRDENVYWFENTEQVFGADYTEQLKLKWLAPDVLSITQTEPVERKSIKLQILRKGSIEIRYNESLLAPAAASP